VRIPPDSAAAGRAAEHDRAADGNADACMEKYQPPGHLAQRWKLSAPCP
jgi:hypothetical protein